MKNFALLNCFIYRKDVIFMNKKIILSAFIAAAVLTACGNSEDSTDGLYTVSESSAATQTVRSVTMPEVTESTPDDTEPAEVSRWTAFELHTDGEARSLIVVEYDCLEGSRPRTKAEFYTRKESEEGEDGDWLHFEAEEPIYFSAEEYGVYVSKTQNYIADNSNFVRYRFNYGDMTVTAERDKLYDNEYLNKIMDTINEKFIDEEACEEMQFNNAGAYWNNVRVGVLTEEAVEPMNEFLLSCGYDPDSFTVVVDTSVAVLTSGNAEDTEKGTHENTFVKSDGERAPLIMMSVYANWAWGFQQTVCAMDSEGNYYSYSTEDEDEFFNIYAEDWYDKLSAVEQVRDEYYAPAEEELLTAIADFSIKLPELYRYGMKNYWEYGSNDGGTTHIYGIFADKDGMPQYAELCSYGDTPACLENNDVVDFVNFCSSRTDFKRIFGYSGLGREFYYPDVYPDLPPMEESHEKRIIEDYAEFMDLNAEYVRIEQYYGTYNGWDALVMESGELGYTDDMKYIDIAGYGLALPSGGLDIHMYKDGEFVDIETAYKDRRIITAGAVAAIDYYNGHAGLYVPAAKYTRDAEDKIPLSESQQEAIRYAYSTFANVWAENIRIIEYYGTYRNCEAVVLSPGYETADEHYFNAAGHKMYLPSGSLNIYLHREGSFYTLEEAYEKGFLTETEIGLIALENRGRYSFAF